MTDTPTPEPATSSLHVWQVLANGRWDILAVRLDGETTPLVTGREATALRMRPFAEGHQTATGLPCRYVRFDNPEVLEVLP